MTRPSFRTAVLAVWGAALLLGATAQAAEASNEPPDAAGGDTARPSPGEFYLSAGPGGVVFDAGASVKAAGANLPGATVKVDSNATLIVSAGYRRGPFQISFTGGYPPVTSIRGAGALAPLGVLGQARYGPAVLEGQYRLPAIGGFQPYIGGGPVFLIIFSDEDRAVRSLRIKNSTGVAIGTGFDYRLSRRWSAYFSTKKIFLSTSAYGSLGGAPISARIRLDPTLITSGLSYHF